MSTARARARDHSASQSCAAERARPSCRWPQRSELPVVGGPPRMRADAVRNHRKVLDAARRLFERDGVPTCRWTPSPPRPASARGRSSAASATARRLALSVLDEREREFQERLIRGPAPLGPGAAAGRAADGLRRRLRRALLEATATSSWPPRSARAARALPLGAVRPLPHPRRTCWCARRRPSWTPCYVADVLMEALGAELYLPPARRRAVPAGPRSPTTSPSSSGGWSRPARLAAPCRSRASTASSARPEETHDPRHRRGPPARRRRVRGHPALRRAALRARGPPRAAAPQLRGPAPRRPTTARCASEIAALLARRPARSTRCCASWSRAAAAGSRSSSRCRARPAVARVATVTVRAHPRARRAQDALLRGEHARRAGSPRSRAATRRCSSRRTAACSRARPGRSSGCATARSCTPPLEDRILASITRDRMLEECDVAEAPCTLDDVRAADEAFIASTVREVMPIAVVDDIELPAAPGPVTEDVRERARRRIRRELDAQAGDRSPPGARLAPSAGRLAHARPDRDRQPAAVRQGGRGLDPAARGRRRGDGPHRPALRRRAVARSSSTSSACRVRSTGSTRAAARTRRRPRRMLERRSPRWWPRRRPITCSSTATRTPRWRARWWAPRRACPSRTSRPACARSTARCPRSSTACSPTTPPTCCCAPPSARRRTCAHERVLAARSRSSAT